MNRTKLFALVAMVALVVHSMSAQQDSAKPKTAQSSGDVALAAKVSLRLGVYDTVTYEVIKGAEVSDALTKLAKVTQGGGYVTLDFLTPVAGFYFIEVRMPGYAPWSIKVRADTLKKDVMAFLKPTPLGSKSQDLDTVKVTAPATRATLGFAGFASRQADPTLHGYFATPEQLRTKEAGRSLQSLLGPGLGMAQQRNTSILLPCVPRVYVDGLLTKTGSVNLRNERTDDYEAVEFYPSAGGTPAEFVTTNACGTVVLWRRRS